MDLLTHQEYAAPAAEMSFATNPFIDGGCRSAALGNSFATMKPAKGETLVEVPPFNADETV